MDYISAKEAARKWELSERRIQLLCSANRIDGVLRFGKAYMIPKDAKKPADARIKSGKYRKGDQNNATGKGLMT